MLKTIIGFVFIAFVTSCSSPPKTLDGKTINVDLPSTQILKREELMSLRVVNDGASLMYVSGERPNHKHRQLYRYDLNTKRETRITHHYGDVISAEEYFNSSKIIYASSTDELKEKAQMDFWAEKRAPLKPSSLEQTPTELYVSDRDGSNIVRITQSPGYDAEPSLHKYWRFIYFVSTREGYRAIYRYAPNNTQHWRVTGEKAESFSPKVSPDGKRLVWLQFTQMQYEVKTGDPQKPETLFSLKIRPSALVWSPSGKSLLFTAKAQDSERFRIWEFEMENNCFRMLLEKKTLAEAEPAMSPDSKTLYFLERLDGEMAISSAELKEAGDCSKSVVF